jgi:hypothetical protein
MRQWNQINKETTANIIRAVKKAKEGAMFSPEHSEAKIAKLPFYRNYHLYRLTNLATLPAFSFEYLGDGKRFYYLDGTPKALASVSAKNEIVLSQENILEYLDFYFMYILSEDGEIRLINDIDDHPRIASLPEDEKQHIKNHHKNTLVEYDEDSHSYNIEATLDNSGTLVRANIAISDKGLVRITDQKMLLLN